MRDSLTHQQWLGWWGSCRWTGSSWWHRFSLAQRAWWGSRGHWRTGGQTIRCCPTRYIWSRFRIPWCTCWWTSCLLGSWTKNMKTEISLQKKMDITKQRNTQLLCQWMPSLTKYLCYWVYHTDIFYQFGMSLFFYHPHDFSEIVVISFIFQQ